MKPFRRTAEGQLRLARPIERACYFVRCAQVATAAGFFTELGDWGPTRPRLDGSFCRWLGGQIMCRLLLLAGIAFSATIFAQSASAADMPVKAPPAPVAPPP